MADLVIRGGTVVDGTGAAPIEADIIRIVGMSTPSSQREAKAVSAMPRKAPRHATARSRTADTPPAADNRG